MRQILLAAAATLALAGCGSSSTTSSTAGDDTSPSASATSASPSVAAGGGLSTGPSSVGTIVVDTSGRTIYMYDVDRQGATSSACTGACASAWPAVPAGSVAADVTGKVGSITGTDGTAQATLNGWPLYYYAKDTAAGDVTGQGVGGIWWVLTPAGDRITDAGGAASDSGDSDNSGGRSSGGSDGQRDGGYGY